MEGSKAFHAAQALVLADSFTQRFQPATVERPKALLPFAGSPMIEHTLQWLEKAGVEECYVFCCAHAKQVESYLDGMGWTRPKRRMRVLVITSEECTSAGEALRAVDQRNVMRGDFILTSADVIANVDLSAAIQEHRSRRNENRMCIMTMICKPSSATTRHVRFGEDLSWFAVDPHSRRLLHYEDRLTEPFVAVDAGFFPEHPRLEVRTDLQDCFVDICAPEVLWALTDNFDYQHLRKDFVAGTLREPELGHKLFVHELPPDQYAVRVSNLRAFDAAHRDFIRRWAFSHCLDANAVRPCGSALYEDTRPSSFSIRRHHVYKEENVNVARSAIIGHGTVLCAGCSIEEGAVLHDTFVGRDSFVGQGAILEGCYLDCGVWIGDGVKAISTMLFQGSVVHSGSSVCEGSLLSFNVVIAPSHSVPPHSRISLYRQPQLVVRVARNSQDVADSDEELEYAGVGGEKGDSGSDTSMKNEPPVELAKGGNLGSGCWDWDEDVVGPGGAGYRCVGAKWLRLIVQQAKALHRCALCHDSWREKPGYEEAWRHSMARKTCSDMFSSIAGMIEEGEAEDGAHVRASEEGAPEVDEVAGEESIVEAEGGQGAATMSEQNFAKEVGETVLRCMHEKNEQNIIVELQGLKLAEDRTFADVARFIVITLLSLSLPPPPEVSKEYRGMYARQAPSSRVELLKGVKTRIASWRSIVTRLLRNEDDQVEVLLTLEEYIGEESHFAGLNGSAFERVFPQLLNALYEEDIVAEDAFLRWEEEKSNADQSERRFVELGQPFLDWLKTAEEESEEEDEGSDEDE